MTEVKIFTRVYSQQSVGGLSSGQGERGHKLSNSELLSQYKRHIDPNNRTPTALVSVSSQDVDTLARAIAKCFQCVEKTQEIWIVVIKVPLSVLAQPSARIHSASQLDLMANRPARDEKRSIHDYVFEWCIPQEFVHQEVCLRTLMIRGVDLGILRDPSLDIPSWQGDESFSRQGNRYKPPADSRNDDYGNHPLVELLETRISAACVNWELQLNCVRLKKLVFNTKPSQGQPIRHSHGTVPNHSPWTGSSHPAPDGAERYLRLGDDPLSNQNSQTYASSSDPVVPPGWSTSGRFRAPLEHRMAPHRDNTTGRFHGSSRAPIYSPARERCATGPLQTSPPQSRNYQSASANAEPTSYHMNHGGVSER